MIAALLLAAAAAATSPCAPVSPAGAADPSAAAEYRAVAEAALRSGDRDTAAAAFRAAAERDPADARSRAELTKLCAAGPAAADPFEEGLRLLDAGETRRAAEAFAAARAAGAGESAALLEGICRYDLGEDDAARPLLREAERVPAHRELARLYLGLVALRAGEGSQAASLFEAATANPALARMATDLSRLASRDGRLVLSAWAESGWDSNVTLAPPGSAGSGDADGIWAVGAAGLWRPRGAVGPYLRAGGAANEQFQLGGYDLAALDGAAGWQARAGAVSLLAEYAYGYRTLAGDPYLSAHRLLASAGVPLGRAVLSATAFVRLESYSGAYDPFSGVLARGEAKLAFPVGLAWLGLAYGAGRDAADVGYLSWVEHGPRAELRLPLGARARLAAEAGVSFRAYDAQDPVLLDTRRDTYLDAALLGELDLGRRLTARLGLQARRALSSIPSLEYDKLVPTVGLQWTAGY
ncbi:hypothetical protein [Anaeromyxobacter dehalogenans]|uniref:Tetratricopeptide TPR_2 n=1 Tax=Anaeromyxobacter dehalogenans (strain 2CP-C) TaxID=290397 RepID=Q2IN96_ANADE|nr:hypothetical protein [Anaeromyxobacter dehalogenans]ABC80278.1 tetratricopeptide TPR_2 [Anaeromyxobacter dehalogenans 2CP-C]